MKVGFLNCQDEPRQINTLLTFQNVFEKHGIEFTSTSPDLILSRQEALVTAEGQQWLNREIPIIILERANSPLSMPRHETASGTTMLLPSSRTGSSDTNIYITTRRPRTADITANL